MNLTTEYLGLKIQSPLIVGASPFGDDVYAAHKLQDSGVGALVMRSLFEEQIDCEQKALLHHLELPAESQPEAMSYFPAYDEYLLTADQYLKQLEKLKKELVIPVIASLNGTRPGGWTDYARRFENAGANAIELNLYHLITDPTRSGDEVEADMLETVRNVVFTVKIPVAIKLSPFHTSLPQFVASLENAGAVGTVVFNRFYQPDFNIEELEAHSQLKLSEPGELLLRLRWLAVLSPQVRGSLAATGGVHTADDAIKAILAGADAVQLVSVLLRHGYRAVPALLSGIRTWMGEHEYKSVSEFRGAMNFQRCPDPSAYERANYQRILMSWRV